MSTFTELFGAAASGSRLKFLYVTTATVWTPPAGLLAAGGVIYREIWGGGGGGGGGSGFGGGGGGGELLEGYQTIPDATPIAIVPGAGGAPGGVAANGGPGGDTSFGAVVARGGGPGLSNGHGGRCFGGGFGALADAQSVTYSVRGGRGGKGRKGRCHGGAGGVFISSSFYFIGGCGGGGADTPGEPPEAVATSLPLAPTNSDDANTGNGGRGRGFSGGVANEAQPGRSGGVLLVWIEKE